MATQDADETAADEPATAVTWDDAVEELYGLLRDDVIPRRDELAKQARAAGDRDTAAAIVRLRKPSAAAWLANMLAREHPDEIAALEELGASMRAAQDRLEGDALRRLSRQRHELVHALVERARRIARDDGVRVGDAVVRELERTITAALADAEAARALAAGRLVTALEPGAGLGAASASAPPSGPAPAPRPARRRSPRYAAAGETSPEGDPPEAQTDDAPRAAAAGSHAERERAERERAERERLEGVLADARVEAERADESVRTARETASAAATEVEEAASAVADLRERLVATEEADRAARDRAAATDRDAAARERDAEDAAARVRRAERDLAEHGA